MKLAILPLLGLVASTVALGGPDESTSQYCYNSTSTLTSFCASFSTFSNKTSGEQDLYVAYSGSPGPDLDGWVALGTGSYMAGSMMFMIWTDRQRSGIALSPRSAVAHVQPALSDELPETEILSFRQPPQKEGPLELVFVCYSCSKWMTLDTADSQQSWIWASNYFQTLDTLHPDATVNQHQLYDKFFVDMTSVPLMDSAEPVQYPQVKSFENFGTWDKLTGSPNGPAQDDVSIAERKASATVWHGLVMAVTFLGVLPLTSLANRLGMNSDLVWKGQLVGVASAAVGLLIAVVFQGSISAGPHQIVGLVTLSTLMLHAYMIITMKQKRVFKPDELQRPRFAWTAEAVAFAGIVNIGLGLHLAQAGIVPRAVYLGTALMEALLISGVMIWTSARGLQGMVEGQEKGEFVPLNQEDDLGEDDIQK